VVIVICTVGVNKKSVRGDGVVIMLGETGIVKNEVDQRNGELGRVLGSTPNKRPDFVGLGAENES